MYGYGAEGKTFYQELGQIVKSSVKDPDPVGSASFWHPEPADPDPEPNPYPLRPNVKLKHTFSRKL